MIKARADGIHGPVFLLGVTEGNLGLLRKNRPIVVDLKELGATGHVVIIYGETENDIELQMRKQGLVGEETTIVDHRSKS